MVTKESFGKGTGPRKGGKNEAVLSGRSKATRNGREVNLDKDVEEAKRRYAVEQEAEKQRQELLAAQKTIRQLNESAQRSGSNNRYSLTQDPSTGEIAVTKKVVQQEQQRRPQSVAVGVAGYQQVPGLQTQSVPPPSISEKPFQQTSFLQRAKQDPEVALVEQQSYRQNVPQFIGATAALSAYDLGKDVVLGTGEQALEFGRYLKGDHPLARELYNDPKKILPATKKGLLNAYDASGAALLSQGYAISDAFREDPLKASVQIGTQIALTEGASRLVAKGAQPVVNSELKVAGRSIENQGRPLTIENIKTAGTIKTETIMGTPVVFEVEAQTVANTLQVVKPAARTAGVAFQDQNTVLKLTRGNKEVARGAARAELEIKSSGGKSVATGDVTAQVKAGKKQIDLDAQLKTFSQQGKETLTAYRATGNVPGVQQLEFPFKQVNKITRTETEIAQFNKKIQKVRKNAPAPTTDSVGVNFETNKYFREFDTQAVGKILGNTKSGKLEGRSQLASESPDVIIGSFSKGEAPLTRFKITKKKELTPIAKETYAAKSYEIAKFNKIEELKITQGQTIELKDLNPPPVIKFKPGEELGGFSTLDVKFSPEEISLLKKDPLAKVKGTREIKYTSVQAPDNALGFFSPNKQNVAFVREDLTGDFASKVAAHEEGHAFASRYGINENIFDALIPEKEFSNLQKKGIVNNKEFFDQYPTEEIAKERFAEIYRALKTNPKEFQKAAPITAKTFKEIFKSEEIEITKAINADTVQRISATYSRGTNKPVGAVKLRTTKPIEGKTVYDFSELFDLKQNPKGYSLLEGESVTRGNLQGGVKQNIFTGDIEGFGTAASKLVQNKKPVAVVADSLSAAPASAATTESIAVEAVKQIVNAENKMVARTGGAVAGLGLIGSSKVSSPVIETTSTKKPALIDLDIGSALDSSTGRNVRQDSNSLIKIKPGETFRLDQQNRSKQNNKQRNQTKPTTEFKPLQIPETGSLLKPRQDTNQDQYFKPIQEFKSEVKIRQDTFQEVIQFEKAVPRRAFIPPIISGTPGGEDLYKVTVGDPKNKYFFDLGVGGIDLVEKARKISKGSAAARVTVQKVGATAAGRGNPADIQSLLGNDFTESKAGNYFIEKRERRITTGGEKRDITYAPRKQRPVRIGKGSTFGKARRLQQRGYSLRAARNKLRFL